MSEKSKDNQLGSAQNNSSRQDLMQEQKADNNEDNQFNVIEKRINQLNGIQIFDIFLQDEHYKELIDNKKYFVETMKTFELRLLNIISSIILHAQKIMIQQLTLENAFKIDYKDAVDIAFNILSKAQTKPDEEMQIIKKYMQLIYKAQSSEYQVLASFYGFCIKQWYQVIQFDISLKYESIQQTNKRKQRQKQLQNQKKYQQMMPIQRPPVVQNQNNNIQKRPQNMSQSMVVRNNPNSNSNEKNNMRNSQIRSPSSQQNIMNPQITRGFNARDSNIYQNQMRQSIAANQRQIPNSHMMNQRNQRNQQPMNMNGRPIQSPGSKQPINNQYMHMNGHKPVPNGKIPFDQSKIPAMNQRISSIKMQNVPNGRYGINQPNNMIPNNQRMPLNGSSMNPQQNSHKNAQNSHMYNHRTNGNMNNQQVLFDSEKNGHIEPPMKQGNPYLPTFIEQNKTAIQQKDNQSGQQKIGTNVKTQNQTGENKNQDIEKSTNRPNSNQMTNNNEKNSNGRKWTPQQQSSLCKFFDESQDTEQCRNKLQEKYGSDPRWKVYQQIDLKVRALTGKVFHKFESLNTANPNIINFKKNKQLIMSPQSQVSDTNRKKLYKCLALIYEAMLNVNESKKAIISQKIVQVNNICRDHLSMI